MQAVLVFAATLLCALAADASAPSASDPLAGAPRPAAVTARQASAGAAGRRDDQRLKIFMHWDMEGASGLFKQQQAWYWDKSVSPEVAAEGRELLTADVNSATRAALDAGVDELIVCDTHHGGGNFYLDKLLSDPRVKYLERSVGLEQGKQRWMPGMDETVDGLMLMAHHAKPGTDGAFLPHVQTSAWADFRINGMSVGEIGIESCYAGHWNVPLVLVQGDEAACREAEQQFPGVVTAAVKCAESRDRCSGLPAEAARQLTACRVVEAIEKMTSGHGAFKPYRPELPMTVTLRMTTAKAAESAAKRFNAERIQPDALQTRLAQQCDVIKWITGTGLDMSEKR